MSVRYDVAVIGAGVFGAWTAWHLSRAGKRVLLVDAWGAGHSRSSSGDETRILRAGYGAEEIYTRMATRSRELWLELFARCGEPLFLETGALRICYKDDPYSETTRETLARVGVPHEIISPADFARRWPQFRLTAPGAYGILESTMGVLMARRSVAAAARDSGADFAIRAATWPDPQIDARTFVFACGPWLPKLFPEILAHRISVTRQEIFYFAAPAGDASFHPSHFPAWVDFTDRRGPYGVPDIESRGAKIGLDLHGEAFDPDTGSRAVSAAGLARMREFLRERIPALADAPLTESRVCQYSNTSTGDFLIDRHPGEPNVWLIGGGSGHGFKHGPAVGEYAAAQILGTAAPEARFSLAAKGEAARRTVY